MNINKVISSFKSRIRSFAGEFIIMLTMLIFLSNLLWRGQVINSDGLGYYDYLPSVFIYHDLHQTEKLATSNPEYKKLRGEYLVDFKGQKVDKYPCGVAVMISPFFLAAHLYASLSRFEADGYSKPYQFSVFLAALIFAFFGLIYLRKLLHYYTTNALHIFVIQCLLVFGTAIPHFIYFDSSYSHIYSFFAITAFLYYVKSFHESNQRTDLFKAAFLLGLIIILRQPNGIIIAFIPFLLGSWLACKAFVVRLFSNPLNLIKAAGITLLVISIQMLLWYIQTGHPIVYSYQGEGFNFLHPEVVNVLFSYRKGLFIYTPLLLVAFVGSFYWLKEKRYFEFTSWLLFFFAITYIISSWWCWYYGCSYGQRPYVDFYSMFSFPLLNLLQHAKVMMKFILFPILLFVVYLNIIQTWQYKSFIFDWIEMDRAKYWQVFLHQESKYRGLLWKKHYDNAYEINPISSETQNGMRIHAGSKKILATSILQDSIKGTLLKFKMKYSFPQSDNSSLSVKLSNGSQDGVKEWSVPIIHLFNQGFDRMQEGDYQLEIPECPKCTLQVSMEAKEELFIPEVQISLHRKNKD